MPVVGRSQNPRLVFDNKLTLPSTCPMGTAGCVICIGAGRHLVPLILLPFERAFEAKGDVPGDHRAPRLRRLIHRHFHRRSHHLRRHLVSPKVRPFADPATELTARNQDTWASLPWSLAGRTREGLNNFGHWSSYTMERTHGSD
jgi:hypothetical protein